MVIWHAPAMAQGYGGRTATVGVSEASEDVLLGETEYLSEARIADESMDGRPLGEIGVFKAPGVIVSGVQRGTETIRRDLETFEVRKGDRLILRAPTSELLTLASHESLKVGLRGTARLTAEEGSNVIVEAVVTPRKWTSGRALASMSLGRRFGLQVQQLLAHAMHRDALMRFVHGGEKCDDIGKTRTSHLMQREGAVLARAPGENRFGCRCLCRHLCRHGARP